MKEDNDDDWASVRGDEGEAGTDRPKSFADRCRDIAKEREFKEENLETRLKRCYEFIKEEAQRRASKGFFSVAFPPVAFSARSGCPKDYFKYYAPNGEHIRSILKELLEKDGFERVEFERTNSVQQNSTTLLSFHWDGKSRVETKPECHPERKKCIDSLLSAKERDFVQWNLHQLFSYVQLSSENVMRIEYMLFRYVGSESSFLLQKREGRVLFYNREESFLGYYDSDTNRIISLRGILLSVSSNPPSKREEDHSPNTELSVFTSKHCGGGQNGFSSESSSDIAMLHPSYEWPDQVDVHLCNGSKLQGELVMYRMGFRRDRIKPE